MCYAWQNPTDAREEVSLKTLEKVPFGIANLNITGGEPTLRADLPELVDLLAPRARTLEISSNGLHAERLEPIIRKYPNLKVRFSLEGISEVNDRIRGEAGGFEAKLNGLRRLQALGGTDLGFATVIQDDNVEDLMRLYALTRAMGVELATSTLHNGFQFHKSDNRPYNRVRVAKEIENLVSAMLQTNSVKNWFRAYLNLGLVEKVLGFDRLMACSAATDFAFIDPWSDVYACNVRSDLKIGNLALQSWDEIWSGAPAREIRARVAACRQNCWMVGSARTAMRSRLHPALPKIKPLLWVIANKLRVSLGQPIPFEKMIDYSKALQGPQVDPRPSFLGAVSGVRRSLRRRDELHYDQFGEFDNR
jgi:Fe-coproporphyrin III synthase